MQITKDEAYDILNEADLEYDSFTADYSGRCMYGAICVGFDLDTPSDQMRLAVAIKTVLEDRASVMLEDVRTDSMGLGYIVYFPSVTCPEWEVDEDDDDLDF